MRTIIILLLLLLSLPAVALQPLQRLNVNDQPTAINQWNFETLERDRNKLDKRVSSLEASWNNYSNYSTIVGWSAYTAKEIYYKKSGTTVFVQYRIVGTSNSVSTAFTLPYVYAGVARYEGWSQGYDNTVALTAPVHVEISDGSSTANFYQTFDGVAWTAGGTKSIQGQIIYETN